MQFQYNSDYPDRFYTSGSSGNNNTTTTSNNNNSNNIHNIDARDPFHFPPVEPISCTRITTRIYNPITHTISTVPNVLVKLQQQQQPFISRNSNIATLPRRHRPPPPQQPHRRLSVQNFNLQQQQQQQFPMNIQNLDNDDDDDENMDDDSSSSSSNSDFSSDDDDKVDGTTNTQDPNHTAYWIQNIIREAIYGRVYKAIILRKMSLQQKQYILSQSISTTATLSSMSTSSTTVTGIMDITMATTPATTTTTNNNMNILQNVEWEITNYDCAIKEMSWQHIRKERDRLAEDPVKEVCAMQYFKNWYNNNNTNNNNTQATINTNASTASITIGINQHYNNNNNHNNPTLDSQNQMLPTSSITITNPLTTPNITTPDNNAVTTSFQQMIDTNVMMPLDLLSDEKFLYSIMPYCNGGELFELLNTNDRFTENEARYWMYQVLNGIEALQHAGICHRDMSLENLLVHNNGALIIDMGMCLRIPYQFHNNNITNTSAPYGIQQQQNLSSSFNNMHIINNTANTQGMTTNLATTTTTTTSMMMIDPNNVPDVPSVRNLHRYMMKPQGTCGKWHYMSPEIHNNNVPFDGYTVDMWAAGVILFLMLTGFPPWDRPSITDERFKYMSAGYLVQMLTEWEIGLSSDAMDLLQRMMFLDPKDRLSLDQVRAHPWMVNGPLQPPTN